MSKITNLPSAEPRIKKVKAKNYKVLGFDVDNAYPQRMIALCNACSTAKQAVEIKADYISGEGFADLNLYSLKVTDKLTADDLLNRTVSDYALHRGLSIHVNWNAAYEIDSLHYVPFEHVRKGIEEYEGMYAVYPDWKGETGRIKKEEIEYHYPFNPDPEIIEAQVEAAGGWENYQGQMLYFSADFESYPLCSIDEVIESCEAEIASDRTTKGNLKNNFSLKHIFANIGEFEDDDERDGFKNGLKTFVGPDGEHVMIAECKTKEEIPQLLEVKSSLNDKLFEYTDNKVLRKIIRRFKQPAILHSITDGGYFNQQQLQDAMIYYNGIVRKERILMERIYSELFLLFKEQVTTNFQIKPLSYSQNGAGTTNNES